MLMQIISSRAENHKKHSYTPREQKWTVGTPLKQVLGVGGVKRVPQQRNFIFSPIILYYIKNQQDVTLAVLFISNCKITLHVSDTFYVHHQQY